MLPVVTSDTYSPCPNGGAAQRKIQVSEEVNAKLCLREGTEHLKHTQGMCLSQESLGCEILKVTKGSKHWQFNIRAEVILRTPSR